MGGQSRTEYPARCIICGAAEWVTLYSSTLRRAAGSTSTPDPYSAHHQIDRCNRCSLTKSTPSLTPDEIGRLYTDAPHTNVVDGEQENVRRTFAGYYEFARPHLCGRERILDVGCDIGLLLQVAAEDGFRELYGIEPNPTARKTALEIQGSKVFAEFYEELSFPPAHFDLITLIHVVDHLIDPREVLQRAHGHLRPGGLILAVVHDALSTLARLLGRKFPPFNLYHLYFFSRYSLRNLLERAGFDVIKVVPTYNCYSGAFLSERIPGMGVGVRRGVGRITRKLGMGSVRLNLPLGNIAIVGRRR